MTKTDPEAASQVHEMTQSDPEKPKGSNALAVGAAVRVARLDSLKACRAELGKLYREARKRAGRYPSPLEAKRLADVLSGVRGALEMEELGRRLDELEQQLAGRRS